VKASSTRGFASRRHRAALLDVRGKTGLGLPIGALFFKVEGRQAKWAVLAFAIVEKRFAGGG
jgi:hypothetical protein